MFAALNMSIYYYLHLLSSAVNHTAGKLEVWKSNLHNGKEIKCMYYNFNPLFVKLKYINCSLVAFRFWNSYDMIQLGMLPIADEREDIMLDTSI